MSMLLQEYSVIIDCSISASGHVREIVDGLNAIEKRCLFQLISAVQLKCAKCYDTQMVMHPTTCTYNVSLASEYKKNLSTTARKNGVIDQVNTKNRQVNKSGQKGNITFIMMLM